MLRRFYSPLFTFFLLGTFLPGINSAQAAVVENLRSFRAEDYTRLVFDLSAKLEHQVLILENPHRIVIDLRNSTLQPNLSGDFKQLDLRDTPIDNIRSATRNGNDIRVVFDLNNKVLPKSFLLPKSDEYEARLVVDLFDTTDYTPPDYAPPEPALTTNTAPNLPTIIPANNSSPVLSALSSEITNNQRDIVIAIAAGHGGKKAPGAVGVGNLQEKRVVLALAKEIEKILQQAPGYRPVMIRSGDYSVGLRERIKIAHDNRADLFIAIHADAYSSSRARGATVYALSVKGATSEQARLLARKENREDLIGGMGSVSMDDKDEMLSTVLFDLSMTASIATSLDIGNDIITSLANVTHMRRNKVEQANFVVLRSPDIPSLLIEAGYITNPIDAENLNSPSHQKKFANALVAGINSYFYNSPPRGTWIAWQKNNGGSPRRYTVKQGDNLSEIAENFKISLATLKVVNKLSNNTIRIGQVLTIPNRFMLASAQISFVEHTVSRGDTLSGIADSFSIPLHRIRETNQLKGDTIQVGQTLRIPSS